MVDWSTRQAVEIIEMVEAGREAFDGLIICNLKHLSNFTA
jgi:hypothetical protein